MSIVTMDQLIAGIDAAGIAGRLIINKGPITTVAQNLYSLWRAAGMQGQGAVPGAGSSIASPMVGSWTPPSTPNGEKLYIVRASLNSSVVGSYSIVDRLAQSGGLSGTLTTAQTVGITSVNIGGLAVGGRCLSTGLDIDWYLEWYTATGSSAVTATITYTNSWGVIGRTTTVSIPASTPAGKMIPIIPNIADSGIQSIQSVNLSATTGTAGSFGVTACKRLLDFSIPVAGFTDQLDFSKTGLVNITMDSVLALMVNAGATTSGQLFGSITIAKG